MPQRAIKFKGWNYKTGRMIDLQAITPLALSGDIPGLFLPDSPNIQRLQWTGIIDKNGREVYEHDIVSTTDEDGPTYWTVGYVEEHASFEMDNDGYTETLDAYEGEFEVVGNIYENIDLLNQ